MAGAMNDKLSIKNMLFSRAIPSFVINVPIDGCKVYNCIDCGDSFILETSYIYHVNRKSVKITYFCRPCGFPIIFKNRCNMLSHIRSHSFKTATINVGELKVEPLPLSDYNWSRTVALQSANQMKKTAPQNEVISLEQKKNINKSICYECKADITKAGTVYKDRAAHYTRHTKTIYTCPACLLVLPTSCGLQAHLRIHLKQPPFFCPDCGIALTNKSIDYPYFHSCESFNMMRATARIRCPMKSCKFLHPSDLTQHISQNHMKKVFKCASCVIACFSIEAVNRHISKHTGVDVGFDVFYQCKLCPGRLIVQNKLAEHLKNHVTMKFFYPCWVCGLVFQDIPSLLQHRKTKCKCNDQHKICDDMLYRVVKRCPHCKSHFTYKCQYNEISSLPNDCPYKCKSGGIHVSDVYVEAQNDAKSNDLVCYLCKSKVSMDWNEIKKHYSAFHKEHTCLDIRVVLPNLNVTEYLEKKRKANKKLSIKTKAGVRSKVRKRNSNITSTETAIADEASNPEQSKCVKCKKTCASKQEMEMHMVSHRDPCAVYQCLECGQCFIVKSSFSYHLLQEHNISDVEEYLKKQLCCNDDDNKK